MDGGGLSFVGGDAACAIKSLRPVTNVHVFNPYLGTGTGRVDEFAVAHVDANVTEGSTQGVEKYQVAGLEVGFANTLGGGRLLVGAAGEHHLRISYAADEASLRTGAARLRAGLADLRSRAGL